VAALADDAGLAGLRAEDAVLAASEAITNSLRYGGGTADVRIWCTSDDLVCEVRDRGFIADPMAGRLRPAPGQVGGRGLWLINQLCDLVQLRSGAAGTVVRLHVRVA
jgi:anti-sigma regulatory factor (Ser/Thr protein kinase)